MSRLTIQNPDGESYRLPCGMNTSEKRVEHFMGYPTIFGSRIDILGKLEDLHPLEYYLEKELETKK